MTREEKAVAIEQLRDKLEDNQFFYLADTSSMTVAEISALRRICFDKGIDIKVVKNTIARKAMETFPEERNYSAIFDALKGTTAILFTQAANLPAKVLKEYRKDGAKPKLKAAYIETAIFMGDDQLDLLTKLKSKEELVGEIIGLLQSPAKNVISALKSGGSTIAGLVKALEERAA
ncbi:MAG: 50S ribosomal protein L10 [Saprospiraceae bacterium]|jgi:large subunit ribosomal protein L10|nr:50S ribosomal protein L10 [Saprospiraceae bacterium]